LSTRRKKTPLPPPGIAYLVGAGPGDPGLLTVRGRELLDSADAIVHDALANPTLIPRGRPDGALLEIYDVGKRGGDERSTTQEEINGLLVSLVRSGKKVVRLKGGDPFVFGRGSEEAEALVEAGLRFEVVPGVTSGIAAPAYAGIPVTHRGLSTSVTFVTGHEDPSKDAIQTDWKALAQAGGTIVLYMGVKTLPRIAAALIEGGLPAEVPAAAIEWGTHSRQRTVVATLETLAARMAEEGIRAPVITVIGWTVVLRDEIGWFDRRPLFGSRVLVTRATDQTTRLSALLREHGAEVLEIPATRLQPVEMTAVRDAIADIDSYEWLAFTSRNGVQIFWEQLRAAGLDARALAGAKIVAVGPATASALMTVGLAVDVQAERFVAEGILEVMGTRDDVPGARVLYLAAADARTVLPDGLTALGADVDHVALYRSVPDEAGRAALRELLSGEGVHVVTFTSASAVRAFAEAAGRELAAGVRAASIGPVTSEAIRAAGMTVWTEAPKATFEALVDAILDQADW
jgi:uroporphyrinogen III methyltransferase / synthase